MSTWELMYLGETPMVVVSGKCVRLTNYRSLFITKPKSHYCPNVIDLLVDGVSVVGIFSSITFESGN